MGLFSTLFETAIDVATSPIDVISNVVTMGGALDDSESQVAKKVYKLSEDVGQIVNDIDKTTSKIV